MKERLSKIITAEGLTPALLAEKIGVQRSGISHILSGRNKPSMDFLEKMLSHFPKINAEWLILGEGSMYKSPSPTLPYSDAETEIRSIAIETRKDLPGAVEISTSAEADIRKSQENLSEILPSGTPKKAIEKIVVFNADKTFSVYFPEGDE